MRPLRLGAPSRGRPKVINAPIQKIAACNASMLSLLYKRARITQAQMENAIRFKRLATSVYPAMGAPSLAQADTQQPRSILCSEGDFKLWKRVMSAIELRCGRLQCQVVTDILLEDKNVPGLLNDCGIDMRHIKLFRLALDVIGETLVHTN